MSTPAPKGTWPELVGMDVDEAARIIRAERPDHRVELCGDGTVISAVVDGGRIAVFYDTATRTVKLPLRIG